MECPLKRITKDEGYRKVTSFGECSGDTCAWFGTGRTVGCAILTGAKALLWLYDAAEDGKFSKDI